VWPSPLQLYPIHVSPAIAPQGMAAGVIILAAALGGVSSYVMGKI